MLSKYIKIPGWNFCIFSVMAATLGHRGHLPHRPAISTEGSPKPEETTKVKRMLRQHYKGQFCHISESQLYFRRNAHGKEARVTNAITKGSVSKCSLPFPDPQKNSTRDFPSKASWKMFQWVIYTWSSDNLTTFSH